MYIYKGWGKVLRELGVNTRSSDIILLNKYNSLMRRYLKNDLDKEKKLLFLGMSKGDTKIREKLSKEGFLLHPSTEFNLFIQDRNSYLPKVDNYLSTLGVLKPSRLYFKDSYNYDIACVKKLFKGKDVVLKVGNLHASENKWKLSYPYNLPKIKFSAMYLPITIEMFKRDARSIRVGYLGYTPSRDDVFITEHINDSTWLKNNGPDEENTYTLSTLEFAKIPYIDELIDITLSIGKYFKAEVLGCDFVVNNDGFMLLELNDIIGCPDGDIGVTMFTRYVKDLLNNNY